MNKAVLAERSTVVAIVRDAGPAYFVVLRCFSPPCDWRATATSWATALAVGIEHEREHGLPGVRP